MSTTFNTPAEKAKAGELQVFENKISFDGDTLATVDKSGTVHWKGPVVFEGDIQSLGSRIELWQTVLSTGDNLIQLNDRIEGEGYEPPYAGVEVKRGKDKDSAYLLWARDSGRWEVVTERERKTVAVHSDSLTDFRGKVPASRIKEESERKFFTKPRVAEAIEVGDGLEAKRSGEGIQINSKATTNTHNFWISNEVSRTKDTTREILPTHISEAEHENKSVTGIRCRTSTGNAKVSLLKNGERAAGPFSASQGTDAHNFHVDLEDGDEISIDIDSTDKARNLSVSVTVRTEFYT
jgi:hypothetical protein